MYILSLHIQTRNPRLIFQGVDWEPVQFSAKCTRNPTNGTQLLYSISYIKYSIVYIVYEPYILHIVYCIPNIICIISYILHVCVCDD